ncbi:MAG: response regulator [Clostridia bacterium]|jgi:two-component system response regulator (stage 0 sporulation protein A)|nr:response regulator [Clostridia bacterium]
MEEKIRIKIIIADDNKIFCKILEEYLLKFEEIEILGIAYTDEEEINMIENLKPEIVITDLVRKHKYTGLQIIKDYSKRKAKPEFLVISADEKEDVIDTNLKIGGYIEKPFFDSSIIIEELRRIKAEKIHEQNQIMTLKEIKIIVNNFWYKILEFFKIRKQVK